METKLNIAVGLILYKPSEFLLKRIELILNMGFHLYIFDNSPDEEFINPEEINSSFLHYYHKNDNKGLGFSLKFITRKSLENGNDLFLYFDQDTFFDKETLEYISAYFKTIKPQEIKANSAFWFTNKTIDAASKDNNLVINSGCCYVLENLSKMEWHDQSMFVEGVDYMFCLDSIINGFTLTKIGKVPGLNHDIEQPILTRKFLNREFEIRVYPLRRVLEVFSSHFRILFKSFSNRKFLFSYKIIYLLLGFTYHQIVSLLFIKKDY